MWTKILVVIGFFLGIHLFLNRKKDEDGGSTEVSILLLFLGLSFVGAASTTLVVVYMASYSYIEELGVTGIGLELMTMLVSLIFGSMVDVVGLKLWPGTIKMGVNILDKRKAKKQISWKERRVFRVFFVIVCCISLCSILFSFFSPVVVVDGIKADTKDTAIEVRKFDSNKQKQINIIEESIEGLEDSKDRVLKQLKLKYPTYTGYALEDSTEYYLRWLSNKLTANGYYELEEKIEEARGTITSLSIDAAKESSEYRESIDKENTSEIASTDAVKELVFRSLRVIGPSCTLLMIGCSYLLVLVGYYNDRTMYVPRLSSLYIEEGDISTSSVVSEKSKFEFDIRWNRETSKAEYRHLMKNGPNRGRHLWKDKHWVKQQISQNKNRLTKAKKLNQTGVDTATDTLRLNISRFEKVVGKLEELENNHL